MKQPLIKLKYYGVTFKINAKVEYDRTAGNPSIFLHTTLTAKLIRQYIKAIYPKKIKAWVKSHKYSGGSSIDVYLSNFDGTSVDIGIFNNIQTFINTLKAGKFDGMTDSYNYSKPKISDLGTKIVMGTRYISLHNEPAFGTKEFNLKYN